MISARLPKPLFLLAALLSLGCDDIDTFIPLPSVSGPAGIIEGTVTYTGPAPCMQDGRVVGAAIVLAFDTRLLPPPDGLGSGAASLDVVAGEQLFAGVKSQLPANGCPAPGDPPVTVSASWGIAPLPAGTYQIRGFYDRDGDFDPTFSISNLPTRGDVGGGAILNAAQVLAGAEPDYREITLGVDGKIPEQGARVSGVAVTFGLELPLERPVFHVAEALTPAGPTPATTEVVMASDYQLSVFSALSPTQTEESFIRLRLAAGVPEAEAASAAQSPFFFPVGEGDAPSLFYSRQDVNGDGVIDSQDHISETPLVPALYPLSVFSKLAEGEPLAEQASPAVLIQGITLYKDLTSTVALGGQPTIAEPVQPEVIAALRPAALCLFPGDASKGGVLVVPHYDDSMGSPVIADPEALGASLSAQFGRTITVQQGCLPEGRYTMNLVYDSGQAWSVPNEAGVCAPTEEPRADRCGSRPRLASQGVVLRVGPPSDPAHCAAHPTPPNCLP
ncbi:MAG TPA: hypothetical protein VLS89_10415 [Candidatus Nanopelagicales bacterium]|nr:hypothetical protein [Candidatus Nanopelagicales bacterium]